MRFLLAIACLLAGTAHAQLPGSLFCDHTRTDELLLSVRVALIEASASVDGRQYGEPVDLAGANMKSQVLVFDAAKVATKIIGFRLTCQFDMPPPVKRNVHVSTQYWEDNRHIPIPVGVNPRLGIAFAEPAPGLRRVTIGTAP